MPSRPIRVFVVEVQPMFRLGLRLTLASDDRVQFAGECATCADALQTAPVLAPDVILLGACRNLARSLPDHVAALRALMPHARIVVVADAVDVFVQARIQTAGASGFLPRRATQHDVQVGVLTPGHGVQHAWAATGLGAPAANERPSEGAAIVAIEVSISQLAARPTCGGRLQDPAARQPFERINPLYRLATPADLRAAALFLASPASARVTGMQIIVDGGACCRSEA